MNSMVNKTAKKSKRLENKYIYDDSLTLRQLIQREQTLANTKKHEKRKKMTKLSFDNFIF